MPAFSRRRGEHQFVAGFMPVLLVEANRPLVQHSGARQLSEAHYDAHANLARDARYDLGGSPDHAYAMAMMGGEPYGLWF